MAIALMTDWTMMSLPPCVSITDSRYISWWCMQEMENCNTKYQCFSLNLWNACESESS
jgi:hypothetical protein